MINIFSSLSAKITYFSIYRLPVIPGMDCSGVVERVGKHVKDFLVGDEVYSGKLTL